MTLDEALREYYAELPDDLDAEQRIRADLRTHPVHPSVASDAHRRRWTIRLAPAGVAIAVAAVAVSLVLLTANGDTNAGKPGNTPSAPNPSTSTGQPWLVDHPAELLARLQDELPELGDRIIAQTPALSESEAIAQVHGRYALGLFWWNYGDPTLDSHTPHPVWLIVGSEYSTGTSLGGPVVRRGSDIPTPTPSPTPSLVQITTVSAIDADTGKVVFGADF